MRWPPPGITRMAVPVALPLAGRYGVMLGAWMLDTRCSPVSETATTSLAVLPSDPGATPDHSGIDAGISAAASAADSIMAARIEFAHCITSPRDDRLHPAAARATRPALVRRLPPLLRSRHRHRPDVAGRGRRGGHGDRRRQLWLRTAVGLRRRDSIPVSVRLAHRALPPVQPARRGCAGRAGTAPPGVCAGAVHRRRGDEPRLRFIHGA